MSQQLQDSPRNVALRGLVHAIGVRLVKRRLFDHEPGTLGIWYWTDAVIKEIDAMGKGWEFEKPDIETVRRRINYLADSHWLEDGIRRPTDDPPLWERIPLKMRDLDPRTQTTRPQSTYRLRKDSE